MRHCCARRIDGCLGRRKLLRTSIRSAERQRIIEAEANRIAMPTRQRRAMGSAIDKHCSSSTCSLAMGKPFSWGIKRGIFSFVKENIPLCPAPLRVRRDSRFVLTNNFRHGMLGAIKAARKKPFLNASLQRGDGRCKSPQCRKGGAFEPRGGNAAPDPPLQGNEVPRIQRGIQVEPRTNALFALSLLQ